MRVGFWAPFLVVNAIENAVQVLATRAQYAVQPKAVFGSLDLARVGGAHRVQRVAEDNPALQEIDLAIELETIQIEHARIVQPDLRQDLRRKQSGITKVMDRK